MRSLWVRRCRPIDPIDATHVSPSPDYKTQIFTNLLYLINRLKVTAMTTTITSGKPLVVFNRDNGTEWQDYIAAARTAENCLQAITEPFVLEMTPEALAQLTTKERKIREVYTQFFQVFDLVWFFRFLLNKGPNQRPEKAEYITKHVCTCWA